MTKHFNSNDRYVLEPLVGQAINFHGLVVDTKSPSPTEKFICLRKMSIASKGQEVRCHHLWVDVSHLHDLKVRLCDWVKGAAYVKHYTRKNGSHSFGITSPTELMAIAA